MTYVSIDGRVYDIMFIIISIEQLVSSYEPRKGPQSTQLYRLLSERSKCTQVVINKQNQNRIKSQYTGWPKKSKPLSRINNKSY